MFDLTFSCVDSQLKHGLGGRIETDYETVNRDGRGLIMRTGLTRFSIDRSVYALFNRELIVVDTLKFTVGWFDNFLNEGEKGILLYKFIMSRERIIV